MNNRILKFRVWDGQKMVYDVVVGKFGTFYVNPMSKGNGLDESDSACLTPFNTRYPDNIPVMQFTGITDQRGKEVFEGDILSWPLQDRKFGVYYNEKDASFFARPLNTEDKTESFLGGLCLIIGNFYENPEMI